MKIVKKCALIGVLAAAAMVGAALADTPDVSINGQGYGKDVTFAYTPQGEVIPLDSVSDVWGTVSPGAGTTLQENLVYGNYKVTKPGRRVNVYVPGDTVLVGTVGAEEDVTICLYRVAAGDWPTNTVMETDNTDCNWGRDR